eukprot:TRINITY_DN36751_c0_g1_i1.p1 TRINITY_DN36751_c0_g1~~TRINITY_DN36751_c0_g1_i1.p1  ORF type:complete len:369 (+),score=50.92 TRINITY_DN36751_c0_g1_i1:61-1107(+)
MSTPAAQYFTRLLEPYALPQSHPLMQQARMYSAANNEVDSYTQNRIMLMEYMEKLGRQVMNVESDGNCMFSAIQKVYSERAPHSEDATKDFRSIAVTELRRHRDLYEKFVDQDYEAYIHKMSRPGEFGDNIVLQAIANAENKKFSVYRVDPNTKKVTVNIIQRNTKDRMGSEIKRPIQHVHLVYFAEEKHYMAAVLHPDQPPEVPLVLSDRQQAIIQFSNLGIDVDDSIPEDKDSLYNSIAVLRQGNSNVKQGVFRLLELFPDRYAAFGSDAEFHVIADTVGANLVIHEIGDDHVIKTLQYKRFVDGTSPSKSSGTAPVKIMNLARYKGFYLPVKSIRAQSKDRRQSV